MVGWSARLQEKATESATELVRVFQKSRPVVQALHISDLQPVDGDGGLAALYAQKPNNIPTPGVQQAGPRTGGTNRQFSQANILDGFQQTSRDGFPGIWSKSQLLNNVVVNNSLTVGDGAPQRSRRSSGFLSLLGYFDTLEFHEPLFHCSSFSLFQPCVPHLGLKFYEWQCHINLQIMLVTKW